MHVWKEYVYLWSVKNMKMAFLWLLFQLSVQSSVVATSRDTRSRQDTMAMQSKDREGLQR